MPVVGRGNSGRWMLFGWIWEAVKRVDLRPQLCNSGVEFFSSSVVELASCSTVRADNMRCDSGVRRSLLWDLFIKC